MWHSAVWILALDWTLRIGFAIHVVMRKHPIGLALSWLLIVLLFPFVGPAIYLLLGVNWLGIMRSKGAARMPRHYQAWKVRQLPWIHHNWRDHLGDPAQLSRIVTAASGEQPLGENQLKLLESSKAIFASMIADIDRAKHSCNMEFYIWEVGGWADEFCDSLEAAAARGLQVRVLVDAVGSRGFLRSPQCERLRAAGAEVRAALPVWPLRALFYRFDLRMHRKTLIIDDTIGYVGSQNIADPKIFRNGAGYGQWVDAMVRMVGPAVDSLSMVFFEDWHFEQNDYETANLTESVRPVPAPAGTVPVQVIPSGPGIDSEAIVQILLNAIYMADYQLIITTPYFVPDESLQRALISAARRGVDVMLLVPRKVDSRLVRLASRPFIRELVHSGVRVAEYRRGMLHTKSITIDHDTSIFGSLNLDPRSLRLNFELTLAIFDEAFTRDLVALQLEYVAGSTVLTPADVVPPAFPGRFAESCVRLVSPLL